MPRTCCPLDSSSSSSGGVVIGGHAPVATNDAVYPEMAAVWPLDEAGDGTADEYQDRTRFALHGTGGDGNDSTTVPTTEVGGWCRMSAHGDGRQWIRIGDVDPLTTTQDFAVSLWAKIESYYQPRVWFSRGHDDGSGASYVFTFGHSVFNTLYASVRAVSDDGTVTTYEAFGDTVLDQNAWYHVAVTFTPGVGLVLFLNGEEDGSIEFTETATAEVSTSNRIMAVDDAGQPTGNLQELRLHGWSRDEVWFAAEHDNFCDGSFVVVGSEAEVL